MLTRILKSKIRLPFLFYVALSLLPNPCHAEQYCQGTVSIKPLIVTFSRMISGKRKVDTKLLSLDDGDADSDDFYRGTPARGFNDPNRNGIGYSAELGYCVWDNLEIFGLFGFTRERGTHFDELPGDADQMCDTKTRHDYNLAFGLRKYFEIDKSSWVPFISASAGYTHQGRSKGFAYSSNGGLPFTVPPTPIGPFVFQGPIKIFECNLQAGVDYRLSCWMAVSLFVGIHYHKKAKSSDFQVAGVNYNFRYNANRVTYPIAAALKFTF